MLSAKDLLAYAGTSKISLKIFISIPIALNLFAYISAWYHSPALLLFGGIYLIVFVWLNFAVFKVTEDYASMPDSGNDTPIVTAEFKKTEPRILKCIYCNQNKECNFKVCGHARWDGDVNNYKQMIEDYPIDSPFCLDCMGENHYHYREQVYQIFLKPIEGWN